MYALVGLPEPTLFGLQSMGTVGVMLFFSISGYLVTQSWLRDPNLRRFTQRRLLRVWPGYAMVILLTTTLLAPFFTGSDASTWFFSKPFWNYLSNLFLLRPPYHVEVFTSHPFSALNGSLWSIPLEAWCYVGLVVAFMGCGRWIDKLGITAMAILLAAYMFGYGGYSALLKEKAPPILFVVTMLSTFFLAGSLLALWPSLLHKRMVIPSLSLIGVVTAAAGENLVCLLSTLPWVAIRIGTASWPIIRNLGYRGDYSYGVYLYAWPMQQLSVAYLGTQVEIWKHLLLAGLLTSVCAVLSWHCVEKRALRFKPAAP